MKVEYSNRAAADLRKVSADAHEYGEPLRQPWKHVSERLLPT